MCCTAVATREGGVDRNALLASSPCGLPVATLAGGVDRNITSSGTLDKKDVATREGGVDRNGIFGAPQTFAERHRPQSVAQIKTTYPKSAESFW